MKDERMYDCIVSMNVKNNKCKKAWHNATKPLNLYSVFNSAFNLKGFSREVPRPSEPLVFN
jgi:hypothetical protein